MRPKNNGWSERGEQRRTEPGRGEQARGGPERAEQGRNGQRRGAPERTGLDRASQGRGSQGRPSRERIRYLYEDDAIVVVSKPVGLPVIAPEGSRAKNLYDIVTAHLRERNPRARTAVVHRLDRDTSGVMMFAKSALGKKTLMSRWNELVRERVYVALAEGAFNAGAGRFDSWLLENRAGTVYTVEPGTHGALRSVTDWRVLRSSPRFTLLELSLETGRKHQIRAQLSAAGHPVAGDSRYGARTDPLSRLCLHASLLAVEHPFTHQLMRFEDPPPENFFTALKSPQRGEGDESDGGRRGPRGGRASRA